MNCQLPQSFCCLPNGKTRSRLFATVASGLLLAIAPGQSLSPALADGHGDPGLEKHQAEPPESGLPTPVIEIESIEIAPIELLHIGAQPRQILRLQPALHSQQQSVMTFDVGGTMTTSGVTQSLPNTPTSTMVLETDVTQIDDQGNRYIEFEYTDISLGESSDLPAEAMEAMRSQLSQLEGLAGRWVINEQGYLTDFAMTPPESMEGLMGQQLQQMVDSIQQMSAPFPAEAIGIGAQWQLPYSTSINGMALDGVATYELVSIDGDRITLATTIDQNGVAGALSALGLPEMLDINIQELNASGQGILEMDLTAVMPIYSDMSMMSNSQFTVGHQDFEIPVSMNMLINMSFMSE